MATARTLPRNRVSVSLRLPESIASTISAYAEKHALRKTDAYLHFLELGMASSDKSSSERALDEIHSQTSEILSLLRANTGFKSASTDAVLFAVSSVAEKYPAIERAFLFGSFARSAQTSESDVDVQLVLDRDKRFNLRDLSRFSKELEQATGRECDIVTADTLNDEFAKNIETERILAYERPQQ